MKSFILRFFGVLSIAFFLSFTTGRAQAATTAITAVGKTVTMKATADGTAPFTYLWQKTAAAGGAPVTVAPLAGDPSTFVLSNVQLTDAGTYTCTVSNSAGKAVGTATLTVNPASPTTVTIIITIS